MSIKIHNAINLLLTGLVFSAVLLFQDNAVAADQEYDIEIVVIEDISGRYAKSENWPTIPEESTYTNLQQPDIKTTQNEKRYRILPDSSFKLNDEISRINDSKEYKILLHTAWRQAGLDKVSAFPVRIASSKSDANAETSYIEGDITLVMSRYLHVSGNLNYYKADKDGYVPYPVKFDRRMKSRETHYIDHPMIGVLVLATPIGR